MKLELFDFIEETSSYFNDHMPEYKQAKDYLVAFFENFYHEDDNSVLSFRSRVKNIDSLKEKLLRNRFYLDYKAGEDAINHLSDLIGITVQCRFIRNEAELYKLLFFSFKDRGEEYYRSLDDPHIFLNLKMPQPQLQRNGFTIYRIDGYYLLNDHKINFELQIKSLVHNFWSEIEHEVVYKNPDFVMYDAFNKAMLGAIRDNLDVVDRQLEIMYQEISTESNKAQIGFDEQGFKMYVASSINELVNRKMKDSVGFTSDFKKDSSILAQYIYIKDFVNGEHNREKMIDYLEHLNYLNANPIDFSEELRLEREYHSRDPFCDILGKYFVSVMNKDFRWHVFFTMLFAIQPQDNVGDLEAFCNVIRVLLIQPSWFLNILPTFSSERSKIVQDELASQLALTLTEVGTNDIVHEDHLYEVMEIFHHFVDQLEGEYEDFNSLMDNMEAIKRELHHQIFVLFH